MANKKYSERAVIYLVISLILGLIGILVALNTGMSLLFLISAAYGYFSAKFLNAINDDV